MRYEPGESMENWAERVRNHELARATKRIAAGEDVDLVMEEMALAITRKLTHPMLKELTRIKSEKMAEESAIRRKHYEETYLKKFSPRADHVDPDS